MKKLPPDYRLGIIAGPVPDDGRPILIYDPKTGEWSILVPGKR